MRLSYKGRSKLRLRQLIDEAVEILEGGYHTPSAHPEGDVLTHTVYVLKLLNLFEAPFVVKLAGLLHDLGKNEATYIHFPKTQSTIALSQHSQAGMEQAKKLLTKHNFPPQLIADVCWLIKHHMLLRDWNKLSTDEKSQVAHHPQFENLYYLTIADWIARFLPDIKNMLEGKDTRLAKPEESRLKEREVEGE